MPLPPWLSGLEIPEAQVAQYPLIERDRSRLMVLRRHAAGWTHRRFHDLPGLLPPDALLVLNDTKVPPLRLRGRLPGGRAMEVLLVSERAPGRWCAMVKGARRLRPGMALEFACGAIRAEAVERDGEGRWLLEFAEPDCLREGLEIHGLAPLPPYIRREGEENRESDRAAYQTIYARHEGAIAAPTAGLHFTPRVFDDLRARGIERVDLTLHVGPGTFQPIQGGDPESHRMHAEPYAIPPSTCRRIAAARAAGRAVIAVGTTVARALESWAAAGRPEGIEDETALFIRPPYTFRVVDGLVTNFHQPASTLILLAAAFHGGEGIREAYREAVLRGYRFFSYGDCMTILPGE